MLPVRPLAPTGTSEELHKNLLMTGFFCNLIELAFQLHKFKCVLHFLCKRVSLDRTNYIKMQGIELVYVT